MKKSPFTYSILNDDEIRTEVKKWLKRNGFTHKDLAAELGLTVSGVRTLLYGKRKIPRKHIETLEYLLKRDYLQVSNEYSELCFSIDIDTLNRISRVAHSEKKKLTDWILKAIADAVKKVEKRNREKDS